MYQPTLTEQAMILGALRQQAKQLRREAVKRTWYGDTFKSVRDDMRKHSRKLDALANRIQKG
jgi:hypothetical protein